MSQPNVVPRVNNLVQSMERPYIDLTGSEQIPGNVNLRICPVHTNAFSFENSYFFSYVFANCPQ